MSYGPEVFRKYLDILDEKNQVNEAPKLTPAMKNQHDAGKAAMMVGGQAPYTRSQMNNPNSNIDEGNDNDQERD